MPVLPDFNAARFEPGAPIDNPLFPLIPGTIFSHGGTDVDPDTGEVIAERNDFHVTSETKEILGVTATVVRDTEYVNGVLVEDTVDWHAQDTDGNVWYLGELTYAFEYDEDGNFVETSTDGSWEAGVDGAQGGHIMRAEPGFGAGYFQEFARGIAEDEAIVVGVDEEVSIGLGEFDGVLQTLDTTALEPDAAEYKYYAPGSGVVLTESLDEAGEVEFTSELQGVRTVGDADLPGAGEPDLANFQGDGSELSVTFLAETGSFDDAVGAYTLDLATGEFGEARILFPQTDALAPGTAATVEVAAGEALGLFLVPDGANLGLDVSDFEDGGLFFTEFQTGKPATLGDLLAPLATDSDGQVLPVQAFHALDDNPDDGLNFLNPSAGVQAVELESGAVANDGAAGGEVTVLGFEEVLTTGPDFDGDFNDAVVAVSSAPLATDVVDSLLGELGSADSEAAVV
jgi:hypothetical protein